jgi:hypothetical protein
MQILKRNKLRQRFLYIIDSSQLKNIRLKIIRTGTKNARKKHKNEGSETIGRAKNSKRG